MYMYSIHIYIHFWSILDLVNIYIFNTYVYSFLVNVYICDTRSGQYMYIQYIYIFISSQYIYIQYSV